MVPGELNPELACSPFKFKLAYVYYLRALYWLQGYYTESTILWCKQGFPHCIMTPTDHLVFSTLRSLCFNKTKS